MSNTRSFIGFPEGMLRGKPLRLPVIESRPDWYALNKLSGLLGKQHPWFQGRPDVCSAIRAQLDAGKPELKRLGVTGAYLVYSPEPDIAGPMLFANNSEAGEFIKNALGSDRLGFDYLMLTEAKVDGSTLHCDLPIGNHRSEARSVVSHRFGKKSSTTFKKLHESASITLWKASTKLPRMDQIRIHAYEVGIPVFGDRLYASDANEIQVWGNKTLRDALRRFSGIGLALTRIDLSAIAVGIAQIEAPLPKPLELLMNKCGLIYENN